MRSLILFICIFIPLTKALPQSPESWPCWMGNDRTGVSTESMPDWPEGDLPIRWTREIGTGFSSCAVVDGRVYTMGIDRQTKIESVLCLDAASGETIWSHDYPSELLANLYEGGPGSTPTIDQGLLYSLGKAGQLYCLNAVTGEVRWEKSLQEDLGVELPEWGFNSSAYVLGDNIILEAGRVVAYDKRTGEKCWQSEKHAAGYGSAARLDDGESTYVVTLDCDAVRVTDAEDGSTVATFPWKSPFRTNSTTPIVKNDLIYVSTGYQVGCGLFRFSDRELQLVYENRDMRNHFNNSILHNGHLYGFDGNSNLGRVVHLVCMELQSGKVMWRHRGYGCGSLMIVDNKLLILSDKGKLALAKATPESFERIAESNLLSGRCWTVPVYLRGHVYARNADGRLVCAQIAP